MKPYTKIYFKYFGFDESSFVPCEVCGAKAVDIHHIRPKSLAKSLENNITNLIALCRFHHDLAHSSQQFSQTLDLIHRKNLLKFSNNESDKVSFG